MPLKRNAVHRRYRVLLAVAPTLGKREIFNMSSGQPVRIATLLDELVAMSSAMIRVQEDLARMRPSEITRAVMDSRAFRAPPRACNRRAQSKAMLVDILNEECSGARNAAGAR